MLLFDVSGSMAADDLLPNRLGVANSVARDFILRQPPGVRIGIVAFSDNGYSIQKPSNNHEELFAAIDRLSLQRGTSLGQGILASINAIAADRDLEGQAVNLDALVTPMPGDRFSSASIVLISDGENNVEPDPLYAAQAAAEYGIRIYTVGVGTAQGAVINVEGFKIHTKLSEANLLSIAQLSNGEYFYAGEGKSWSEINAKIVPQMIFRSEQMEITSVLAGVGVLFALLGGLFSLIWFGRMP